MSDERDAIDHLPPGVKSRNWIVISTILGSVVLALLMLSVYLITRPEIITVEINAPPGTRFLGNVNVDQRTTLVSGTTPEELTFRGRHLAFNVIPDAGATEGFSVTLMGGEQSSADGVGGWYDARGMVPDLNLQPLNGSDWSELRNQYRRAQLMGASSMPAQ